MAQPAKITPQAHQKSSIPLRDAARKMTVGIIPMLLLGLLVGLFSFGLAFRQTGYLSELANGFGKMLFFPPVLLVFGLIAWTLRDKFFFFYPIAVWALGEKAIRLDLFQYVGYSIPGLTKPGDAVYVIAVIFWYMVAYIVGRSLYYIEQALRGPSVEKQPRIIAHVLIMIAGICLMTGLLFAGTSLYDQQQRDRTGIHIPNNSQLSGDVPRKINNSFYAYTITYAEATQQKDGTYQQKDGVDVAPVKNWWQTDTRQNCGDRATSQRSYSQGAVPNEYQATSSGVLYAKATFSSNSSNPPLPEYAFQLYRYCWVTGKQIYVIEVDDQQGLEYLKKYPIEETIDAIVQGQVYSPGGLPR